MIYFGRSAVRKVLASGALTTLLMCAPMQLAAQEREAPIASHGAAIEWFAGVWGDLTAWLTGGAVPSRPRPELPAETQGDNGCAVDPHGVCG